MKKTIKIISEFLFVATLFFLFWLSLVVYYG